MPRSRTIVQENNVSYSPAIFERQTTKLLVTRVSPNHYSTFPLRFQFGIIIKNMLCEIVFLMSPTVP